MPNGTYRLIQTYGASPGEENVVRVAKPDIKYIIIILSLLLSDGADRLTLSFVSHMHKNL